MKLEQVLPFLRDGQTNAPEAKNGILIHHCYFGKDGRIVT
jgi:hypothetical protein